jgi:hypothetical protein
MIEACANWILAQNHENLLTVPEVVGEKWTERFLARHPTYHLKVQESLEISSHKAFQPRILPIWFQKLREVWEQFKIHSADCYNMDETGFRIGVGGKQRVVTRKPRSRCFAPSSTNCDYVTVIGSVSTSQDALPPMVILPGNNVLEV